MVLAAAILLAPAIQKAQSAPLTDSETALQSRKPSSQLCLSTLPKADYIFPATVKEWLSNRKKVLLVDVRKPEEYQAGHIGDALNIPYDQVEQYAKSWNKKETFVFYCISSSWRAPYSANLLKDRGFQNVYILQGGIVAWKAGGQTLTTANGATPEIAPYPKNLQIVLRHPQDKPPREEVLLTAEALKRYDGKEGRPAYVAVFGKIYDITQSRLWRGGEHAPSHREAFAGRDVTSLTYKAPHGIKELEKFPLVGRLIDEH